MTSAADPATFQSIAPQPVRMVDGSRMMMRGVQKQESAMITSAMRGTFKEDPRTRNEFLDLVG